MSFVSYAQNYEDVMLARAFAGLRDGFYIDVGAQDPRFDSVTKAFYDLGWHGINLEPVEHWHRRMVEDRPRDINLCLAAGAAEGTIEFHETTDSGLSTGNAAIAQRHREQGYALRARQVPVSTLDAIWDAHVSGPVHFLKVDVEGAEAEVLRGLDLSRHRPWVILVEATEPNSRVSTHAQWESLLVDRGYRFVYQDGLNRFYVADEHAALAEAFASPPNIFDGFIRREQLDQRAELEQRIAELDALAHRRAAYIDELVANIGKKDQALAEFDERHRTDVAALANYDARHREDREALAAFTERHREHVEAIATFAERHREDVESLRRLTAMLEAERAEASAAFAAVSARLERSERSGARLSRALVDAQSAQLAAAAGWAAATAEQERTLAVLAQLERDYQVVLSSRSWRLTAPLRRANALALDARSRLAGGARALARFPAARRLAALALAPFPRQAAAIKRRLYGSVPTLAESVLPATPLPISEDAEAILARCPVVEPSRDDGAPH